MKCVCPMGGDRTCPDDCPLAVWANLTLADRKARRKSVAEKLYKQGFTMDAIATQLGVGIKTISRDLENFVTTTKSKDEKKTANNPKGAGRPKGSKRDKSRGRPKNHQVRTNATKQEFEDFKKEAAAEGTSAAEKLTAFIAGEEVDPTSLSKTAQVRLEAAIRQHQRRLDSEFEQRVRAQCEKRIEETILPHYQQTHADYLEIIKARNGAMSRKTFRYLLACLHPDRGASEKMLSEAFNIFKKLELVLCNEEEMPTSQVSMPSTVEEMMAMRKTKATKKTKSGNQMERRT